MLHIDRIYMRMPDGFGPRAPAIARLVGEYLALVETTGSPARESLTVGPLRITPDAADEAIARHIAEQIASALGS